MPDPRAPRQQRPLRVGVHSPHPMVAHGLDAMLAPHVGRVLGRAPGAVDAVVYDLSGLRVWGLGSLEVALAQGPVLAIEARPRTVSLIGGPAGAQVREVLPADIDGCGLVAAVRRVTGRGAPLDLADPAHPAYLHDPAPDDAVAPLTRRESQVVALAARGLTNVEIGEHLYLSINSVKTYLRTAFRRLGVANRAEAAAWLTQHAAPARS